MSLESQPQSKLSSAERALYESKAKDLGFSEEDFIEMRDFALNSHSPAIQEFFAVNNIFMKEKPERQEISEMTDSHSQD